jgi:uncharacterized SAM-binding protein YcdF (DUF218 family)
MSDSPGRAGILEHSTAKIRRRTMVAGLALLGAIAGLIFYRQMLWAMGAVLVNYGLPQRADIVVSLAGDMSGHRILEAAELVRGGYAPKVLVSGTGFAYGVPQTSLEIDFAVRRGYPREYFVPLQHQALNTRDEARVIVAQLRTLGVHSYLLVTSYYHTARAGRILRRTGPELEMHVVGARTPHWNDGYWWKEREGEKIWLEEMAKNIADFFRI